ncbi:MAG: helix-turn-helix domain-containing protein [Clostridia bacterium]|nr:helix-turn-helix domain-containing protein [Clostridia bacterium]
MIGSEREFHWNKIRERLEQEKFLTIPHRNQKAVSLHDHFFLELTYIQSGSAQHTLDGQTATLHPGDYLIVDYGSRHSYQGVGNGYDNLDCLFLPELLDPILKGTKSLRVILEHYLLHFNMQALVQNPAHMVFHDSDGRILELLTRIREEEQAKGAGYTELVRCYLIEILLLTMRRLDDVQAAAAGQDISQFLVAYVAEHYMEPLTLGDLAARLNYSLPYVSKKFKEDVGVSFVNYLQNYRVMQGCRLLSSSRYSLGEITEMVGYRDSKFFSTLIKRMTGLSPADFRRRHRS